MKTGYKIVLTTDRTLMSEYSGELRYFPLEKTILRTLLKCGEFLSLRKIRACKSSLWTGRPFKIGKNTFHDPCTVMIIGAEDKTIYTPN